MQFDPELDEHMSPNKKVIETKSIFPRYGIGLPLP
jgi:hypothetical protein